MRTILFLLSFIIKSLHAFVSKYADNDETIRNDIESTQTILEMVQFVNTKRIYLFRVFPTEMEMKMEPSSPTDKRQQFSRCSSTNSVITSNSSAQNSGEHIASMWML